MNTAFLVGLSLLTFAKGVAVAAFISRADYGVWGIIVVSLGTLLWLKQFGVGDKFIQQDDEDQEAAFQKAFTLELTSTGVMVLVLAAVVPLYCWLYGEWVLLAPGLVYVLLIMPAGVLRAPLWIYYREMRFFRQRALQAVEPVVGVVVTLGLAIAGVGFWSLVIGLLVGSWAAAVAALWSSPYRLRLRWERVTLRIYWSFSWPLFVVGGTSMVIAQSATIAVEAKLGLAGVGAIALAANITQLTNRVSGLVTGTLYPAICAIKDKTDVLYESFVKSNRLALMWAVPFGVGLTLFSDDLVTYALGERWRPAVGLLQVYGATAAVAHIGFNWDAYFRARSDTRPMAVASTLAMVAFLGVGIPLVLTHGLTGLAIGVAVQAAVHLACRIFYLKRLFADFRFVRHAMRAAVPTVVAALVVLAVRAAGPDEATATLAALELALYAAVTGLVTVLFERRLLREAAGYLLPRVATPAA